MNPAVPLVPDSAPFTPEQRAWLNGFLAGLFSRGASAPLPAGQAPAALVPLTILFGSQTGTAEGLARRGAKEAGRRGFAAAVLDLAQFDVSRLPAERNVLLITSTYGDGEPPDNAKAVHAALREWAGRPDAATRLAQLRYSVCALGDSNYVQFCRCGADFDTFLGRLGAERVTARVECDVEYEDKFAGWLDAALTALSAPESGAPANPPGAPSAAAQFAAPVSRSEAPSAVENGCSRKNPFRALLISSRKLNGEGSAKQVQHVEFDLADAALAYEAGDALGILPSNCPELVGEVLAAIGCDGEEAVSAPDGSTTSLRRALTEHYDLGRPSPELLALLALTPAGAAPIPPGGTAAARDVVEALRSVGGVRIAPAEFTRVLRKLQPRLYSISSSPRAHAGQVHLTVGVVRYAREGRVRKGVCSTFLAERLVPGQGRAPVFVHTNKAFRLPTASDAATIMIGPGTGIAPFRAFLHDRRATGATGRNWLFFGDQHAASDFLYREELEALRGDGVLTRLDTAFSRDQPEKIYVQHRMLEHARELFAWVDGGAHLYVCGDASRMAKDVDAALHTVIERGGGKTPEQAAAYVQAMKAQKRYARDVY